LDLDLLKPHQTTLNNISASPYGYGSDLINWHNNITKVQLTYRPDRQWSFDTSLRLFWGIPGAVDMADYNRGTVPDTIDRVTPNGVHFTNPNFVFWRQPVYTGSKRAFGASAYLNMSTAYRASDNLTASLHLYNVLGWFDKPINKRNYFLRSSHYIIESPAVSWSLSYKF
jgi:hypothetical protein